MKELTMNDFETKNVEITDRWWYSFKLGKYEITIEPHAVAGYSTGLYEDGKELAIEKRAIWLKNHPLDRLHVPKKIDDFLINKALENANLMVTKHIKII